MKKTIDTIKDINKYSKSAADSDKYYYCIEHFFEPTHYDGDWKLHRRETYRNFERLIEGLWNYEIPYQIASADEIVGYYSDDLIEEFRSSYYENGGENNGCFYPNCQLAEYMVCDMINKGRQYSLIYDLTIRVRRYTLKQMHAQLTKEENHSKKSNGKARR